MIQGKPWALFSRLYVYFYARVLLRGWGRDSSGQLVDDGCRPRDALKVLKEKGAPPEEQWPFDPELLLDRRPPLDAERYAIDLDFSYERCRTVGETAHALAQGFPVVIGMSVDEAFTKNRGPDLVDNIGPRIGGHMGTLLGNQPAFGAMIYQSSWTANWRDGGRVLLSHDVIEDQLSQGGNDAWAVI